MKGRTVFVRLAGKIAYEGINGRPVVRDLVPTTPRARMFFDTSESLHWATGLPYLLENDKCFPCKNDSIVYGNMSRTQKTHYYPTCEDSFPG